jgi:hypothetical protein
MNATPGQQQLTAPNPSPTFGYEDPLPACQAQLAIKQQQACRGWGCHHLGHCDAGLYDGIGQGGAVGRIPAADVVPDTCSGHKHT